MSCYFIARIKIHDRTEYQRYLDGFDDVFAGTGGEVLVVDDQARLLEGENRFGRTVVIRFPSEAAARAWYESNGYQQLANHRRQASTADIILVTGRD